MPRRAGGRASGLLVGLLALAVLPQGRGTEKSTELGFDLSGTDTALAGGLRVTPDALEFTHVVGQTDCPQSVGRISIRNTGTSRVNATIQGGGRLGYMEARRLVIGGTIPVEGAQTVE